MSYCYSPFPITEYRLQGLDPNEVKVVVNCRNASEIWNFFWLSYPPLDFIPGSGKNWTRRYKANEFALSAVITDVHHNAGLRQALDWHPYAFLNWFQGQTFTEFLTFRTLGEWAWVHSVMERAEQSGDLFAKEQPPVSIQDNIVHVNFRNPKVK